MTRVSTHLTPHSRLVSQLRMVDNLNTLFLDNIAHLNAVGSKRIVALLCGCSWPQNSCVIVTNEVTLCAIVSVTFGYPHPLARVQICQQKASLVLFLAPKIKLNLLFVGKFERALGGEDIRK